ncbi:DUF4399 domain-containing protein [Leisingera thetidis]|uniref:DUF4399 domain-containing protein n=1 Tax=Leisingera thetidis TaxID=2930199 RepID=UPI0021F7420D|nr:DUF4399 domain-containing protein [Leisingera thetidis]
MKRILAASVAVCLAVPLWAQERTPSHPDAKVFFVNLKDGDTVTSPVTVVFGLSGMDVAPAGSGQENSGHHHLLIDRPAIGEGEDGADELLNGLPADAHHVHFGGGQTETTIELPPGRHSLQLVLGDASHVPHESPVVSEVITIHVE